VHFPLESVTTVDLPSDALLVAMLPEPLEWVTVPPGPVVVPLTLPLPAVIDVDIELAGADSPFFISTTLQFSDEDEDDPAVVPAATLAPDVLELELLELVWAMAADAPMAATARNATSAFTSDLPGKNMSR
jgi:hypothetical protein